MDARRATTAGEGIALINSRRSGGCDFHRKPGALLFAAALLKLRLREMVVAQEPCEKMAEAIGSPIAAAIFETTRSVSILASIV